jgi:hypothetical protein
VLTSTTFPGLSAGRAAALLLLLTLLDAATVLAQSSGRSHLVRSLSGSKGTQEGNRFLIEDPRVVFQAGTDRQVMVLFEWQGPPGRHRCEGRWKDPTGNVVFSSASEVEAPGPRFGVYWGLSIPDSVATGTWVLEAVVDGEPRACTPSRSSPTRAREPRRRGGRCPSPSCTSAVSE